MAPLREELHPLLEVLNPVTKWLEREVGFIPWDRDDVVNHVVHDALKGVGDDRESLYTTLESDQVSSNHGEEDIVPL